MNLAKRLRSRLFSSLLLQSLLVASACADDSDWGGDTSGGFVDGGQWGTSGFATGTSSGSTSTAGMGTGGDWSGSAGGTGGIPPEEDEAQGDFNLPQASGRFVYAANELSDRLAVIDSETLRIDVVDVCRQPEVVQALPQAEAAGGSGRVAVLCTGSNEVAIVQTNPLGESTVELREVVSAANALVASPDGRYLIAYHDIDSSAIAGAGSDQELTVVDLVDVQGDRAMSVGAHPRDLQFSRNGERAYVITADGVNVIHMLQPDELRPRLIPVVDDTSIHPDRIEVEVSTAFVPAQAITRVAGEAAVTITNLETAERVSLPLPGYATDLDIDASGAFAYLMLPGYPNSQILEIGLSELGPTELRSHLVTGAYVGLAELSDDGQTMLLYSSVNPWEEQEMGRGSDGEGESGTGSEETGEASSEAGDDSGESTGGDATEGDATGDDSETPPDPRERLTIVRRGAGDWATQIGLFTEIPIRGVGISPDGRSAISLHDEAPQLNATAPWPYTLIDLASEFPAKKLQMVAAKPRAVMFTPAGDRAAIAVRDTAGQIRAAELIDLASFIVDSLQLGSPPLQTGYVAATDKIFVTQDHAGGRLTFIGSDNGVQTVTGFELNDTIKD